MQIREDESFVETCPIFEMCVFVVKNEKRMLEFP